MMAFFMTAVEFKQSRSTVDRECYQWSIKTRTVAVATLHGSFAVPYLLTFSRS